MIYFDNAATGFPKSEHVFEAMRHAFFECGNAGRSGHSLAEEGARLIFDCRKAAGSLFGCEPEQVVLTKNATEALNIAVKGLYKPGKKNEVLISSLEHNSVLRPVHKLSLSGKVKIKQFEVDLYDDDKTINNFYEQISNKTSMVVCLHASNVCGRKLPIKRLSEIAKEFGAVFILDAAQTAGYIPLSCEELEVDIMCIPGHKGLCGPMGTGLMVVNQKSNLTFETIMEGGSGVSSFDKGMPAFLPERLEYGTQNICGYAGLAAAVSEHSYPIGLTEIFSYLLEEISKREDITLHGAPQGNITDYTPVLLFNKKGVSCEQVAARLNENKIAVRAGYHCSPLAHASLGTKKTGGVRISLGSANTTEEIDYFLNAL